jgi:hypothetical protein
MAGNTASRMMRLVVSRSLMRRIRSTMKPASASTSSSLPSSDDWKLKKPMSIERFDPRAVAPIPYTSTIAPIISPYTPSFHSRTRE